ncbi:MAG TPA: hypothetical protein PLD23_00470 [Armatimonadota bacterium]|nr:hypothetical protein [Armatimonadota bacterium]
MAPGHLALYLLTFCWGVARAVPGPTGIPDDWLTVASLIGECAVGPTERIGLDTDGDGDPDRVAYRDGHALVVAVDADDDARTAADVPDADGDVLAIDLQDDGRIDRILDRFDDDGDGDADREHHYYIGRSWLGEPAGLVAAWDLNDNNRLWALHGYSYDQGSCQWDSDFGAGGAEGFCLFGRGAAAGEWVPRFECPFYFFDPDHDHHPEAALRLEGAGARMQFLRLSFDADDDAGREAPYDYDVGLMAVGPVDLPDSWLAPEPLRWGFTSPFLQYNGAESRAPTLPWSSALLVWDENDRNIDPGDPGAHERWEGVINAPYTGFPQVGGPSCGRINKRYELDADNSGGLRLYPSWVDCRLHLLGAEYGELLMDADDDGSPDWSAGYRDTDRDGFFDQWTLTRAGGGEAECTIAAPPPYMLDAGGHPARTASPIAPRWGELRQAYGPLLAQGTMRARRVAHALGLGDSLAAGPSERGRYGAEGQIRGALARAIDEAVAARDAARAVRLSRARECWEAGLVESAVRWLGAG